MAPAVFILGAVGACHCRFGADAIGESYHWHPDSMNRLLGSQPSSRTIFKFDGEPLP